MANDEDVARLRQGTATWNAWQEQNPERRVDLGGANLVGGANLEGVDLFEANLGGANLEGVDLGGANLIRANLGRANLGGANLGGANLVGANLVEANLERARLTGANLMGADLGGADLDRADLGGANLVAANLMANLDRANLDRANLFGAYLMRANLRGANLGRANLGRANLDEANLRGANLIRADLISANLRGADLGGANLEGANLDEADLISANLDEANLRGANLRGANLISASLVGTDLTDADLTGCCVYGISAWDLKLERAEQRNLVITTRNQPEITVDNLEVAQFIYLLLHNEKIRDVIDTITSKVVLILGRFTPERKAVLNALREKLREHNYLPVLFDFPETESRDLTETISLLARMARFIIADLTDPSSIPKELEAIVPGLAVPVQPLIEGSAPPFAMFKDYWKYDWVLPVYRYDGLEALLAVIAEKIVAPAEMKLKMLEERRRAIEAELMRGTS